MKIHSLSVIIIVIAVFVIFWGTFDLYFVADDFVFVKSARDLSFLDLLDVEKTLEYPGVPNRLYDRFIPLFALFKLDYAFWGQNAVGYHLTNLLLHVLCCIEVYVLAFLLTRQKEISLVSGIFFATHYAHVGGLAFVANRQAPTACVFYIFSVIMYIRYVQKGRQKGYYVLALFGYFCALFSYEVSMTLPLLLLIYEFLFAGKRPVTVVQECLVRYIPFALVGGFHLLVYIYIVIIVPRQKVVPGLKNLLYPIRYTLDLIIPFASARFSTYVALRSFLKSQLEASSYSIIAFLVIILLLGIIGLGYFFLKTSRVMKFLVCWIYVTFLLGFISPYYAESLLYIPSVGFCIGLALGLFTLFSQQWFLRRASRHGLMKIGIIVMIIGLYSLETYTRISWWKIGSHRAKQIISGIQAGVPQMSPDNCIFLVDPPGHYNFFVPTFLSDEDFTSALQVVYNDSTILADRIFSRDGSYPKPHRIEIQYGSRDCLPEHTYIFKYSDEKGIQQVFNDPNAKIR